MKKTYFPDNETFLCCNNDSEVTIADLLRCFFFSSPVESATQILILKESCQPKKDNHWIYEFLNSFSYNIKLLAT